MRRSPSDLELAPALERPDEGHLVGVLEVAAHGDAPGDPGDGADVAREALGEVHRRGLALERRVGGQDDLLVRLARRLALRGPLEQLADAQPVGADAVHGRDGAMQHVVAAAERTRALDGEHVERLLHDAQPVARRATGRAQMGHSGPVLMLKHDSQKTTSSRTAMSAAASGARLRLGRPQQVVRQPLGRLGADARQARRAPR